MDDQEPQESVSDEGLIRRLHRRWVQGTGLFVGILAVIAVVDGDPSWVRIVGLAVLVFLIGWWAGHAR